MWHAAAQSVTFKSMNVLSNILVVAATARELVDPDGWRTLVCGVGPVDAAATTAAAIATLKPRAVLHVGIAGANRDSLLVPPALVIGAEAYYCDLTIPEKWAPRLVSASPALVAAAQRALPAATTHRIGTSATVGGTTRGNDQATTEITVEAMEGFAVLRAAQLAGVPAIEVRAISNFIDEHDRHMWQFDEAFTAICAATPALVTELSQCVR